MCVTSIDGCLLQEMFANGYRNMLRMEQAINELNVFPIPDGDTGTNMAKTIGGGLGSTGEKNAALFMKAFSKAVLLTARGNSGVILSQFIRGMAEGAKGKAVLYPNDFVELMDMGVSYAYEAVNKPVEGTMLTVLRESASALHTALAFENFEEYFSFLTVAMKKSLRNTPNLLVVLKEAGVVDSGGSGVVCLFEGMLATLRGKTIAAESVAENPVKATNILNFGADSVLEYGYCTEFILQLMHSKIDVSAFSVKPLLAYLESVGDSVVCVLDGDIVKVHVHTFTPEKVLGFARNFGEFLTVKIENMSVQHNEITGNTKQTKKEKYAVMAVASGEGLQRYFKEIGAALVIDGGQTQNPSTQDFLAAFDQINAEHIIVLPNNSNVILAAKQAAELYDKTDVRVLETKSVAAGYAALSMMNPSVDTVEAFMADMEICLASVTSGSVVKAVHEANMHGVEVHQGAYLGIADGVLLVAESDKIVAAISLLENVSNIAEKEVVTIFYGASCTKEEAQALVSEIDTRFPYIECGMIYGGQAVYDFYLAIE